MKRILGLDFGNVIRPAIPDGQHGSFDLNDDSYLESPGFPEAKFHLLVMQRHFKEIHLISRSGDGRWNERRKWLSTYGYDGIFTPNRIHFCLQYEDKLPICRTLGITHFVDDNLLRVLGRLTTVVPNLFWFRAGIHNTNPRDTENQHLIQKHKIKVAFSWPELSKQLIET